MDVTEALRAEAAERFERLGPHDRRTADLIGLAHLRLDIHLAAINRIHAHLGLPAVPPIDPEAGD
jgi:hypothetical protein